VFEKGDAWYRTGVLARCDDDGDYWIVDHVDDLIRHRSGPLPTAPIEEAVWEMSSVSAAAAYGLALPGSRFEVPVVAVVLRPGAELDRGRLAERVERSLPEASRPIIVRIVGDIPMTAGYRFRKQALRAAAIDAKDFGRHTLWYDASKHTYRELDAAAYARLTSSPAAKKRDGRRRPRVKKNARRNP
jgi:acyl-CoA synthetase (AMP-forming)/AMP-acid ligase II